MDPAGKMNESPYILFQYLENNIYGPLGYRYFPRFSFSDVFNDLIFLKEDYSLIRNDLPLPNSNEFFKMILKNFANIEKKSADYSANKTEISDEIRNILKKFHIFWNVLR